MSNSNSGRGINGQGTLFDLLNIVIHKMVCGMFFLKERIYDLKWFYIRFDNEMPRGGLFFILIHIYIYVYYMMI